MNKILIVINFDEGLYNFRKELIEALVAVPYQVHIALPAGEYTRRLQEMGCIFHETSLSRRGTNPLQELALINRYRSILKEVKPQVVLTYTIKPNLYMGLLCGRYHIPYITTITGLGTAVEGNGILQKCTKALYAQAMKKVRILFFQNRANEEVFQRLQIASGRHRMLPGSGVNLEYFSYQDFPENEKPEFLFISRVMKEKGIGQFMDAAEVIRKKYPDTVFRILGFLEDDYEDRERFEKLIKENIISFEGSVENVKDYIGNAQCTIHPSFYPEGMSNVCLESAACGRAVITTRRPGCEETVEDGVTGYLVREKDSQDLIHKIEQFLYLSQEERKQMGIRGRERMKKMFDRKIVVENYLGAIQEVID